LEANRTGVTLVTLRADETERGRVERVLVRRAGDANPDCTGERRAENICAGGRGEGEEQSDKR
jgi:hypothetical protein